MALLVLHRDSEKTKPPDGVDVRVKGPFSVDELAYPPLTPALSLKGKGRRERVNVLVLFPFR